MFKKIKKIGIYCALFMALFSLKNDAANCASFSCNARQYSYNGRWNTNGQPLDAAILRAHLNNQGNNALKELARLILAQGGYQRRGNIQNNNIDYIIPPQLQLQQLLEQRQQLQLLDLLQQLLLPQPQPQLPSLDQVKTDLTNTLTVRYVRQHMFDHGHMGWYPFCMPYDSIDPNTCVQVDLIHSPRGLFNIDNAISQRITRGQRRFRGYNIDPIRRRDGSLFKTANNIIQNLFFENITFLGCGKIRSVVDGTEQFAIDVVYNGPDIPGLEQNQSIGIDISNNGYQQQLTNNVRIIVGVKNGYISLVSIFPVP